jgi:uncharacterized membrane protein
VTQLQSQIKHGLRKAQRVALFGLVMLAAAIVLYIAKAKIAGDVFLVLTAGCVLTGCVMAYSARMRALRQLQASIRERANPPEG